MANYKECFSGSSWSEMFVIISLIISVLRMTFSRACSIKEVTDARHSSAETLVCTNYTSAPVNLSSNVMTDEHSQILMTADKVSIIFES